MFGLTIPTEVVSDVPHAIVAVGVLLFIAIIIHGVLS